MAIFISYVATYRRVVTRGHPEKSLHTSAAAVMQASTIRDSLVRAPGIWKNPYVIPQFGSDHRDPSKLL